MTEIDVATFGRPNWALTVQPSREFTSTFGRVGAGQYAPYNPTGPVALSLQYNWRGATLAAFRELWEDKTGLNFGSGWFLIELPMKLHRGPRTPAPTETQYQLYDAHFVQPFACTLQGWQWWQVSMQIEVDQSPRIVANG